MNQEQMQNVLSDEKYVDWLLSLSAEDAARSLNENGIEITAEDLTRMCKLLEEHADDLQVGKISKELIDELSGGSEAGAILASGLVIAATLGLLSTVVW